MNPMRFIKWIGRNWGKVAILVAVGVALPFLNSKAADLGKTIADKINPQDPKNMK